MAHRCLSFSPIQAKSKRYYFAILQNYQNSSPHASDLQVFYLLNDPEISFDVQSWWHIKLFPFYGGACAQHLISTYEEEKDVVWHGALPPPTVSNNQSIVNEMRILKEEHKLMYKNEYTLELFSSLPVLPLVLHCYTSPIDQT